MSSGLEKIMVIEAEEASRRELVDLFEEAGYEVSAPGATEGLRAVLAFGPDLLIIGAEPAQLDCCSLVAELKGTPATESIRVILLASGGPAERTRGLDLGADDVLSRLWDPSELLARVRAQLRVKHSQDLWRERARLVEEGCEEAHATSEALAVTRRIGRDAFSLTRTLKRSVAAIFLLAAVTGAAFLLFYRREQKETRRAYAAIARLERRATSEQELLERARRIREELERHASGSLEQQRQELERQSERLRAQIAGAESKQVATLRGQLARTDSHLRRLENESKVAQTIIQSYAPSVCLLRVAVIFRDEATGRPLHFAGLGPDGGPLLDSEGNPLIDPAGSGPELALNVYGTGFLAGPGGQILTNRHVIEPWWKDDQLSALVQRGVRPVVAEINAYFPGVSRPMPLSVRKVSPQADLALVQGDVVRGDWEKRKLRSLALDGRRDAAVSGQPVVLLGYATGLDAILARAGEETVAAIASSSNGDPAQIMAELARRALIRPISTQGHLGDVLPDRIVYDAQTTSGGSGGPLFNAEGKVIGVNFAVVRGFGGSNFAIPIRYAETLLSR